MRVTTWMAPSPMAELLALWMQDGTVTRLTEGKRIETQARAEIAQELLGGFTVEIPPTALHLWLQLPEHWRGRDAVAAIARHGVAVSDGKVFSAKAGFGENHLRICLGNPTERSQVRQGLGIIARVLGDEPAQERSIV